MRSNPSLPLWKRQVLTLTSIAVLKAAEWHYPYP